MTTTHPALDTRQARTGAKQEVAERAISSAPENGPRPTAESSSASSSQTARSASKEPRGPRTYLPGYYLG